MRHPKDLLPLGSRWPLWCLSIAEQLTDCHMGHTMWLNHLEYLVSLIDFPMLQICKLFPRELLCFHVGVLGWLLIKRLS